MNGEIDVCVDFVSPAKPGRYISYWRLTSPDLQKFGQQVWVLIEVFTPPSLAPLLVSLDVPPLMTFRMLISCAGARACSSQW